MIGWLAQNMLGASLLMLLVLLIRRPVAALFGAGWAYALWLLPLVRLIMPHLSLGAADMSIIPSLAVDHPRGGRGGRASAAGRRIRAVDAHPARGLGRGRGRLPGPAIPLLP